MRYDLEQLSSRDFEELTRDLFQAEWGVALEAFKRGRDQGIDLRHISANQGATIIQCKHYASSGYAKLLAHLRGTELEKVRRLKPERYVLVTSVELNPSNKSAIVGLFDPFIRSPADVVGANDIDGLLQRHAHVMSANFKLWLTSTEILERVLHNAEACRTEFEIERVMRKLPLFVQSAAFPRARDILETTRVLVISGIPGIGKTTLAEILLYAHLEQGFEPVVIQTDVRDGKNLFRSTRRQIFYFDDFLGQTFLGESRSPTGLNSDAALVDFVAMIRATEKSRFILTTREHLLQNVSMGSERLRHSMLLDNRCLLELADYSRGQRARILYNHLYFSELPRDYKEQILRDDFFLEVASHKHFSPRLIEWLSSWARLRQVSSDAYQAYVRNLLANPRDIWSHAFNRQISAAARNVLFVLYTQGESCELIELEPLWNPLNAYTARKYNRVIDPRDYQSALRELDNAFVTYTHGNAAFLNPSIREMVGAEIGECPEHALDLIVTAGRFRQIITLLELAEQEGRARLLDLLARNVPLLTEGIQRLLHTPDIRWGPIENGRRHGTLIDVRFERRLVQIGRASHRFGAPRLRTLFENQIHELAERYRRSGPDITGATTLIKSFETVPELAIGNGQVLQRELIDAVLAYEDGWRAFELNSLIDCAKSVAAWGASDQARLTEALKQYREQGVDDQFDDCDTANDYAGLRDELVKLGERTGEPFTGAIGHIEQRMAELEPDDRFTGTGESWKGSAGVTDGREDTDQAIREVFDTLLE